MSIPRSFFRAQWLAAVLILAALATRWPAVAAGSSFVFNNGAEPETLDPALITGVLEMRVVDALFEGLMRYHPETLAPEPAVAERCEMGGNGLLYTFHLRKDALWSDGQRVISGDFLYSWRRVLTPATAAPYAYQLYPVAGAEDFHKGRNSDFSTVGVSAPDEATLVVRLARPCPYFLDLAAFPTLYPVPRGAVEKHGDRWVRPGNLVSNGAFTLTDWKPRERIELARGANYWDRASVKLEKVVALPYDELETAYKLYSDGKIHWLADLPPARLEEARLRPDFYIAPYLGTYFYRFNVKRAPCDDARVRKALSLAVDRRLITEHVLKGMGQPATWFCPPVSGYEPVPGLTPNREEARKLLAQAGYGPGGKALPEIEILYNTSESHKAVAEALAQQWSEALGLRVSLRNTEWKIYLSDMDTLNYQVCRAGWIGDYNDPNTFFDMWVTGGGNNRTGWSNPRYDELLAQSQREPDRARRLELFRAMERILVEDELPILPLYIYVNKGLIRDEVRGFHTNIRGVHPLRALSLAD